MCASLLRVLRLPSAYLDWTLHQQLWEKTHDNIQGLTCIDKNTAVITSQSHIFLAKSTDTSRYANIVQTKSVADLANQTDLGLPCDHFSDPDHRDGLVFFVFDVDDDSGTVASALVACDLTFAGHRLHQAGRRRERCLLRRSPLERPAVLEGGRVPDAQAPGP